MNIHKSVFISFIIPWEACKYDWWPWILATNTLIIKVTETANATPPKCDQEPGTVESPRLLELDLSLNQISKVPHLQNLPSLEWLSLEVLLDLEYEPQNELLTHSFSLNHACKARKMQELFQNSLTDWVQSKRGEKPNVKSFLTRAPIWDSSRSVNSHHYPGQPPPHPNPIISIFILGRPTPTLSYLFPSQVTHPTQSYLFIFKQILPEFFSQIPNPTWPYVSKSQFMDAGIWKLVFGDFDIISDFPPPQSSLFADCTAWLWEAAAWSISPSATKSWGRFFLSHSHKIYFANLENTSHCCFTI